MLTLLCLLLCSPVDAPLSLAPQPQIACVGCTCGCQEGCPCECARRQKTPEAVPTLDILLCLSGPPDEEEGEQEPRHSTNYSECWHKMKDTNDPWVIIVGSSPRPDFTKAGWLVCHQYTFKWKDPPINKTMLSGIIVARGRWWIATLSVKASVTDIRKALEVEPEDDCDYQGNEQVAQANRWIDKLILIVLPERQPSCTGCQCGCQQGDPCQCDKPKEIPDAAPAARGGMICLR